MHRVQPKVFLVAETQVNSAGVQAYLDHVGASDWNTDAFEAEFLTEFMGRLCYRSWKPGLNANVSKVRVGNPEYLKNILGQRHGSVFEHATVSFVFVDVSRTFTHELVRHRAGTAFSQESLRYVRLVDLGLWLPPDVEQTPQMKEMFERTFTKLEEIQQVLAEWLGLDNLPFNEKKHLTSAMRRLAPMGMATTIGATFNHRTLRHLLELRTARAAEAEIRVVFDMVAEICMKRWPNLYQDFQRNSDGEWQPKYSKI
jgi:thymidylate synthase (FAD)